MLEKEDTVVIEPSDHTPFVLSLQHESSQKELTSEIEVEEELAQDFPEGGYGWVAVFASFIIHIITIGIPGVFGVFQPVYLLPGTHSTIAISLIGSTAACGLGLFALPSGRLVDLFGHRLMCIIGACVMTTALILASYSTHYWQIFLTHGLMFGIGSAIAYFPALTIISHYFNKKKGLATGIAVSGSGIGGLFLAPLLRYLIATMGLKPTLRYTGIASGITVISMAFLLIPRLPSSRGQSMNYSIVAKDPRFIRLFMTAVFGSLDGALIVGLLNGASAFGRIALGFNADLLGHVNSLCFCISLSTLATLLMWPFATSFALLTTFGIVYGFFVGGFVSLFPTAILQLFGTNNIGTIIGMVYSGFFVGNLLGPPSAGLILDALTTVDQLGVKQTNVTPSILLGGFFATIASCLIISLKMKLGKGAFFVKI
ncbi:hypothetical protein HDV02_006669 [Globomyces sp. JEL0801]|nr:hypothetical protein HDV02_006669 [Globomyces sp. JEL0801]